MFKEECKNFKKFPFIIVQTASRQTPLCAGLLEVRTSMQKRRYFLREGVRKTMKKLVEGEWHDPIYF